MTNIACVFKKFTAVYHFLKAVIAYKMIMNAVLFALSGLSCSAGYRIEHISVFKDLRKYSSLATA